MFRRSRCAIVLSILFAVGCGGAAPEPDAPATGDGATAPPEAAASTQHLGEWVMAPPPGQEREVALVRYALADPPAVESFEAMKPLPDEQEFFTNILRTRKEDPGSPILVSLQRKLDELEGVRIRFLPDKFIVTTANGTDITAYVVEEDLGHELVILEEGTGSVESRRKILSFDGADRMVITIGPTRVPMNRVAEGSVPAPNEVPSVGGSGAVSVGTSGAGVPASGDAAYDTCVKEYYACIEKMSASDRAAMADLLEQTKRIFTDAQNDPSAKQAAFESCQQAVSLAKATFCQ